MPQNTPMKRQFVTIDGRTVMSNLPQHWGGNDWKITGVDNPLPVRLTGSYVGYSTETKPTGKKGETFLELDTLDVYIHDGSGWVKI